MKYQTTADPEQRIAAAVRELQDMIQARYPTATFTVSEREDPCGTYLKATVDIEDTDEVVDLVIDRLLEMQIDEGLPVYVIPVRPIERVLADQKARPQRRKLPTALLP